MESEELRAGLQKELGAVRRGLVWADTWHDEDAMQGAAAAAKEELRKRENELTYALNGELPTAAQSDTLRHSAAVRIQAVQRGSAARKRATLLQGSVPMPEAAGGSAPHVDVALFLVWARVLRSARQQGGDPDPREACRCTLVAMQAGLERDLHRSRILRKILWQVWRKDRILARRCVDDLKAGTAHRREVRKLLKGVPPLEMYIETLFSSGYDTLHALAHLNEAEMAELGVKRGHRKLLLGLVKAIQPIVAPIIEGFTLMAQKAEAAIRTSTRRRSSLSSLGTLKGVPQALLQERGALPQERGALPQPGPRGASKRVSRSLPPCKSAASNSTSPSQARCSMSRMQRRNSTTAMTQHAEPARHKGLTQEQRRAAAVAAEQSVSKDEVGLEDTMMERDGRTVMSPYLDSPGPRVPSAGALMSPVALGGASEEASEGRSIGPVDMWPACAAQIEAASASLFRLLHGCAGVLIPETFIMAAAHTLHIRLKGPTGSKLPNFEERSFRTVAQRVSACARFFSGPSGKAPLAEFAAHSKQRRAPWPLVRVEPLHAHALRNFVTKRWRGARGVLRRHVGNATREAMLCEWNASGAITVHAYPPQVRWIHISLSHHAHPA